MSLVIRNPPRGRFDGFARTGEMRSYLLEFSCSCATAACAAQSAPPAAACLTAPRNHRHQQQAAADPTAPTQLCLNVLLEDYEARTCCVGDGSGCTRPHVHICKLEGQHVLRCFVEINFSLCEDQQNSTAFSARPRCICMNGSSCCGKAIPLCSEQESKQGRKYPGRDMYKRGLTRHVNRSHELMAPHLHLSDQCSLISPGLSGLCEVLTAALNPAGQYRSKSSSPGCCPAPVK